MTKVSRKVRRAWWETLSMNAEDRPRRVAPTSSSHIVSSICAEDRAEGLHEVYETGLKARATIRPFINTVSSGCAEDRAEGLHGVYESEL